MNFVLTNTAYRKFMIPHGLPENPTGKNLFDTFPNLPPFVPEEYRRVFDTGKTLVTEEIIAAGGRDCIFEVRKIPILLAGKVHRVMTVFHDITEHKIMEKQIRRYSEQLEQEVLRRMERIRELERRQREDEKLAAAGRMAARIAHEINNPLAGIKNAFQLIKGAVPESHPYFHYVGLIEKEINRIARIIQQMFGLYRPEPEMIREFRPDQSIREVAALMETTCQDSRVAIRVAVADALPAVHLSEGLIRQVLFNLIKNAIEVSPPGGEITVGAKTEAQTMVLTVADQGPGIPEDIRARIFDPFFTTKTGSNAPGLGLGLYISKSIVEFLRGTIECHCPPGKGTTFRVVLPLIAKERENEPWPKAEES